MISYANRHLQINYIYGEVVVTLAMVENSRAQTTVNPEEAQTPFLEESKDTNPSSDHKVAPTKTRPITSSMNGTLRHLRRRAGIWSCFRGIVVYAILSVSGIAVSAICVSIFSIILPNSLSFYLGNLLSSVLVAPVYLLWTHIVISERSQKYWWRRFIPMKKIKKIFLPTLATSTVSLIPIWIGSAMLPHKSNGGQGTVRAQIALDLFIVKWLGFSLTMIVYLVFIALPFTIMLTRVQASLLEEEPIVPFDRSFEGKVVSEEFGGSGVLSMKDAWQTFDWESRVRVLKLLSKIIGLNLLVFICSLAILAVIVINLDRERVLRFFISLGFLLST